MTASRASRSLFAALAALAWTAGGCASVGGGLGDALHAWRAGQPRVALAAAEDEYARFRDGNDLDESAVRAVVAEARRALAERPIVPTRRPEAPVAMEAERPGAMREAIREDLLSGRITAVLRGVASVEGLGLRLHAPELIAIIYRREPIAADGGLLEEASVALRSVAAKRAALDALRALAAR